MLHGEREKGKSISQRPPTSFPQEVGMHRNSLYPFMTAASLPPPTKRCWTTLHSLSNPVNFIFLFEALLLPKPLSSHLHPFFYLIQTALAYPHGSHTGNTVSKLWYHHPLYVGYSKAAPEYCSNSWPPPTTHLFHKTQLAHYKVWVSQDTSLGDKRSRAFSYTHCIQQTCSLPVPLLKVLLSIKVSLANSPKKERLLKHKITEI